MKALETPKRMLQHELLASAMVDCVGGEGRGGEGRVGETSISTSAQDELENFFVSVHQIELVS